MSTLRPRGPGQAHRGGLVRLAATWVLFTAGCSGTTALPEGRPAAVAEGMVPTRAERGIGRIRADIQFPGAKAPRRSQLLDPSVVFSARLTVTGPDIAQPPTATASISNGGNASVELSAPAGRARVIDAVGLDLAGNEIENMRVRGVADVAAGETLQVKANLVTTPTADILLALRAAASPLESQVDLASLQRLVSRVAFGTADGSAQATFQNNPSLIDAGLVAQRIVDTGAIPEPDAAFVRSPVQVSGTISRLLRGQTAVVTADDPASAPVETDAAGNYTLTGITPGKAFSVRAASRFYLPGSASLGALGPGGRGNANISLSGHYLHKITEDSYCGAANSVIRFTQMPVRLLTIVPTAANAAAIGWEENDIDEVDSVIGMFSAYVPDVMQIEYTKIYDNDPDLVTHLRRSDIYIQWMGDVSVACGAKAGGCATIRYTGCDGGAGDAVKVRSLQFHVKMLSNWGDFRKVALHEVIHALGHWGHSDHPGDILCEWNEECNAQPYARWSGWDLRTLRFLYSLPADLTRDRSLYDLVPADQVPTEIRYFSPPAQEGNGADSPAGRSNRYWPSPGHVIF